jgi:hypothetical protein
MSSRYLPVSHGNVNSFQDDDGCIVAPPRSYLYCLEPIGIGTASVECLTSYLSRLAQVHLVHPRRLIIEELFPIFERAYLPSGYGNNNLTAFWKDSATLNSTNLTTRDWVQALEKLTLRSDLRYLTMLTWSDVLSPRYLLRRSKSWCAFCYREWCESGFQTYEPLIWMLEIVTVCTHHNCYLTTQCVNQNCKRRISMLAPRTRPGYCDYCGCWLGEPLKQAAGGVPTEEELEWQKWVVEAVSELLAAAPFMSKQPRYEIFAEAVTEQLNNNFGGNVSALARRLHVSRRTIKDWVKGIQVPQIDSLLRFCYLAHVSLLCLLAKGATGVDPAGTGTTASQELKKKPKKHYRIFHGEQVRLALESELLTENYPPRPMSVVAKRLNFDHSFLCKHFPDLCRAISARYQAYRKKQRDERKQRILDEVRQVTYRVHKQGLYPSQERVRLLLAKPGSIKEPGALAVWHETLAELGLEGSAS